MYLEAITVCCGYSDFLLEAIPFNLPHLDRWLVVTEPSDEETREVCRKFNLDCLQSTDGRDLAAGQTFAKGRLVERGLQHLSASGHRLHIDADIALPMHTRTLLDIADLQEDTIYGADRLMVRSWEDWQKLKSTGYLTGGQYHAGHAVTFPPGFSLGSRWASSLTGWVPIGAFQLWHSSMDEWRGSRIRPYPRLHGSACRSDVQMSLQWDRKKRVLIPELVVVHLESETSPNGTNWEGRKTKPFGPPGKVRSGEKSSATKTNRHDEHAVS